MYIDEQLSTLDQAVFFMDSIAKQHTAAMGLSPETPTDITAAMGTALFGTPTVGQEGIGSFLSNLWDAFLNIIRTVGERLKDFWDALWDNSKTTKKAVDSTTRKTKQAVNDGQEPKSPVSAKVKSAKPRQAEAVKTINKVEAINEAMAEALNKGAFSEALDILEDMAKSKDVTADLEKVARIIGDFSASLLEMPEVQSAPITAVRSDDVSGGKVERRLLGRVDEKAVYIDTTYDPKKNPVKSILGVTVLSEKDLKQLNLRSFDEADNKQYIPGSELVNILDETGNILSDIERARGSRAKARTGASATLYARVKDVRKALASIDKLSNHGQDESKVKVTTDQARQIVEWGKAINEMCTKAEFCQGKVSHAMGEDIRKLVTEINAIEFK